MLSASEAKAQSDKNREPFFQGVLSHQLLEIENRIKYATNTGNTSFKIESGINESTDPLYVRVFGECKKKLEENGYSVKIEGELVVISWDVANG